MLVSLTHVSSSSKTVAGLYRFEHVPLVTPNGDVLVNELNFEVCSLRCNTVTSLFCIQLI